MPNRLWLVPVGLIILLLPISPAGWSAEIGDGVFGVGHPASESDIALWNIDISPDGQGLPPGQGTAR